MAVEVYVPDTFRLLVEACEDNFGKFAFDGFGIMLSDEQLEARRKLGPPGPRGRDDFKYNWLSGGQRAGKTVFAALCHAEAGLYKRGLDTTDRRYWQNYQYGTLAIAPTNELSLRLWTIMDELGKGANDAQYDRKARRARGGGFLRKMIAGKAGEWAVVRFSTGSRVDFRSSEGFAYRLEGGQWWFVTWDEWASQPAREIHAVASDVLLGRSRDHDAKIMPMAWPKPETEHQLIRVIRAIESGHDRDAQVIYLSAEEAYFTNKRALAVERRSKTPSEWQRTVLGKPAGGASVVFKPALVDHMVNRDLTYPVLPEEGYHYLSTWDVALAHDSTVGVTWRIPVAGSRPIVTPEYKARIVNVTEMKGAESLTLDQLAFSIAREQQMYHSQTGVDATAMGGVAAFRQLRHLKPPPWAFTSRGQDRLWGNMRLASITNGLDCLSWGRVEGNDGPWGLVESPAIVPLMDQLASFDPDGKDIPDDWVWAFLIGLWYIRRNYSVGEPGAYAARPFDIRRLAGQPKEPAPAPARRRRGRLVGGSTLDDGEGTRNSIVYIRPEIWQRRV